MLVLAPALSGEWLHELLIDRSIHESAVDESAISMAGPKGRSWRGPEARQRGRQGGRQAYATWQQYAMKSKGGRCNGKGGKGSGGMH